MVVPKLNPPAQGVAAAEAAAGVAAAPKLNPVEAGAAAVARRKLAWPEGAAAGPLGGAIKSCDVLTHTVHLHKYSGGIPEEKRNFYLENEYSISYDILIVKVNILSQTHYFF